MKKTIISILAGACLTFSACSDYLDVSDELASNLTIEQVFDNVKYTKRWHANIFNCISEYSQYFWEPNGLKNPWATLCGETSICHGSIKTEMVNGFNASNANFHRFAPLYQYIRQAYLFIENAKPIGVTTDQEKLTEEDINRMKT